MHAVSGPDLFRAPAAAHASGAGGADYPVWAVWAPPHPALERLDGGAASEAVRFSASFAAPAAGAAGALAGVLHVAADSRAAVFLNGRRAGGVDSRVEGAFPLAWGELREAPAAAAIPVQLAAGTNRLDGAARAPLRPRAGGAAPLRPRAGGAAPEDRAPAVYVENVRKVRGAGEGAPLLLCMLLDADGPPPPPPSLPY